MAEVGVLNLTIHDNSSEAAKGLNTLADALAAVRDAKKSFSLSGVAQSIKSLVDNVKSSTPVIGQLTKLFNSITAFSKLGEINIDVEKFAQLKQAVSGFSIGNSGSQMKALREALGGSWNTKSTDNAVTAMGKIRGTAEEWKANGTASSINAVAKAMKEYTEANSKLPADSPFTAVASQMQTEARTVTKATEQVKEAVGSWRDTGNGSYRGSDSGMTPSLMKRLSTQIYSSGPTGVQDMLRQVDQQVAGLEKVEETVHQATDAVTQYQASVSKTVEPVASMAEKSGACSDALANVNNEVVTASKSMDDISKQAFIATRNIQNLINTLNTKIDEKGFRNVVDALTGVSRVNTNLAETAAKSFDDKFFARADEIKAFIDMLNNPTGGKEWSSASFDQAMGLAEQTKDVINETNSMFTVPAMDEQGAFQTASEEVMRYTELLAKSRQELEFWDNEYARIQKQIKYNGSTPERMAELAQADKSGTFALAKVGEYETALRNVMDYAKSYSENMNAANQATGEQANAMDAVNNAAAGAGNRVKDIRSETEKLERDLQNVLAITSTWKTMMSDQKATIKEVYKNNPLVSGVIGKMSELKGEDMNSFIQSVNEIISQTSEASVKSEQLFALLNESAAVAPAMEKVADATGNTAASLNNLNKTGQSDFGQKAAMDAAKAFMAENSELELLQRRYDELLVKLGNGVMFGTMDTKEQLSTINELTRVGNKISALKAASQESIPALKDLDRELKQKKTDANEAASGFERFKAGLNHIKEGTKKLFSPLTKLGKQFVSIARRMAIRAVIRQFTSGLKEGLENLYNYSKAAKTSFAPAMDEAATSLQQMKNSLGAAVAPAIQALIPILQTVVNWVITGLNYLNQFFALLNGQKTWTRALPATTTAFGKQEKAAKGAAAAVKDLLADWDELNIIQSETGGGGSSGSGLKPEDYLKMFEEATIFDKEVTEVVGVIKENMSDVLNIVKEIGAAILLWKVSNAFAGTIGALTSILTLGVIVQLASDFTSVTNQAFIDTGNEFYLLADGIFTTALTAIGKKLADVKLGEGAGNIAGSIILAVSAGTTFAVSATEAMDESKRNMLTLVGAIKWGIASALAAAGLMKLGWGTLAAILGGTIGVTVITAITYAVEVNAKAQEEANAFAKRTFSEVGAGGINPDDYVTALKNEFTELTKGSTLILSSYVEVPDLKSQLSDAIQAIIDFNTKVMNGEGKLTAEDAQAFSQNWTKVLDTLDRMGTASYDTLLSGLVGALQSKNAEIRAEAEKLRISMIMVDKQVDEARAKWIKDTEDLESKIKTGVYSDEDLEEYKRRLQILARETGNPYVEQVDTELRKGNVIDFGDEESALQNALDFIDTVGQAAQEALEQAEEAKKATEDAAEIARADAERYLTPEELPGVLATIDATVQVNTEFLTETQDEIRKKKQEAYDLVLKNMALAGAKKEGVKKQNYWDTIVKPLVETAEKYGYTVPQEIVDEFEDQITKLRGANEVREAASGTWWGNSVTSVTDPIFKFITGKVAGKEMDTADLASELAFLITGTRYNTPTSAELEQQAEDAKNRWKIEEATQQEISDRIWKDVTSGFELESIKKIYPGYESLVESMYSQLKDSLEYKNDVSDIFDLLKEYDEQNNNPELLSQYADWLTNNKQYTIAAIREAQKQYDEYLNEKKIQEAIDAAPYLEFGTPYPVNGKVDTETWDNAYNHLNDTLQDYINGGGTKIEDMAEAIALAMLDAGYDIDLVTSVLKEALWQHYNEEEPATSGKFWNAGMLIAGTTQEMYYGRGYNPSSEEPTEAEVANGTRTGTTPIVEALEAIYAWLRGPENNKPINVVVKPSSGWGEHNQQSRTMFGAVTGYTE